MIPLGLSESANETIMNHRHSVTYRELVGFAHALPAAYSGSHNDFPTRELVDALLELREHAASPARGRL
jgi:ABC-type sulfate transport system permease component